MNIFSLIYLIGVKLHLGLDDYTKIAYKQSHIYMFLVSLAIASSSISIIIPVKMSKAIHGYPGALNEYIHASLLLGFCNAIMTYLFMIATNHNGRQISTKYFSKLLNLKMTYFDLNKTGNIIYAFNEGLNAMSNLFSIFISCITKNIFPLIFIYFYISHFSNSIISSMFVASFIQLYLTRVLTYFYKVKNEVYTSKRSEQQSIVQNAIDHMMEVKMFSLQNRFLFEYEAYTEEINDHEFREKTIYGILHSFSIILAPIVETMLIYFSLQNELPTENIMTLLFVYKCIQEITRSGMDTLQNFTLSFNNLEYFHSLIGNYVKPEMIENKGRIEYDELQSYDISINDVSFGFNENKVLFDNLNHDIPQGRRIAIIGDSGMGKSSLIKLLLGIYKPHKGSITLNDKDINDYSNEAIAHIFGIVPQEPLMFNASIYENITVGFLEFSMKIDHDYVIALMKELNMDSILEKGLKSSCGNKGSNLSGGEKQRIALVRALIRKPKILILDEATSALDNQNQNIILNHIRNYCDLHHTTLIMISHQPNVTKDCEHRLVLN